MTGSALNHRCERCRSGPTPVLPRAQSILWHGCAGMRGHRQTSPLPTIRPEQPILTTVLSFLVVECSLALCSSHCNSWAADASTIGSGRDLAKYGPCRVSDSDIAPNVARAGSLRCVLDPRPSGVECNTHFGLALGDLGRDKPLALSSYVSGAVLRITSRLDSIPRQFHAALPGRNRLSPPSRMGRNECGRGRMCCESRYLFPTTAKGRNLLRQGALDSDSLRGPPFDCGRLTGDTSLAGLGKYRDYPLGARSIDLLVAQGVNWLRADLCNQ
jgi:hypothetical protein